MALEEYQRALSMDISCITEDDTIASTNGPRSISHIKAVRVPVFVFALKLLIKQIAMGNTKDQRQDYVKSNALILPYVFLTHGLPRRINRPKKIFLTGTMYIPRGRKPSLG